MSSDIEFDFSSDSMTGGKGHKSGILSVLTCTPVKGIFFVVIFVLAIVCLHRLIHGQIIPSITQVILSCCCLSVAVSVGATLCYYNSIYAWIYVILAVCVSCGFAYKVLL